jgi:hypothetical protein
LDRDILQFLMNIGHARGSVAGLHIDHLHNQPFKFKGYSVVVCSESGKVKGSL